MASIQISELHPAGSELLHDSESFLNELNDEQDVLGGGYFYYFNTNKTVVSAVTKVGNTINANTKFNNNTVGKAGA